VCGKTRQLSALISTPVIVVPASEELLDNEKELLKVEGFY